MYVYIYTSICIHVCVHIYIHMYTCMCTYTYIHMYTCMCTYIYTYIRTPYMQAQHKRSAVDAKLTKKGVSGWQQTYIQRGALQRESTKKNLKKVRMCMCVQCERESTKKNLKKVRMCVYVCVCVCNVWVNGGICRGAELKRTLYVCM